MSGIARNSRLNAYQSVAVHGGVAAEDPHRLILMLMDGALARIAAARGAIACGELGEKAQLLQRVLGIVAELRGCLDLERCGPLALNLSQLYDYMERQLIRANVESRVASLDEVHSLLAEIRNAWEAVPLALRGSVAR